MKAATRRGTLWGGRVDCYVLHGGQPIVVAGRTSPLEARQLVDECFARTTPVTFRDLDGNPQTGRDARAFVDALFEIAARKAAHAELAREWLRACIAKGQQLFSEAEL